MLQVTGDLAGLIEESLKDDSFKSLLDALRYLHVYGVEHTCRVQGSVTIVAPDRDPCVHLIAEDGTVVMTGGLVHCSRTHTWSVRT